MESGRLSRKTLVCYSAGSVVESTMYAFCSLYLLNFYTDVVHLDPRLIGYAFAIRFFVDAVIDPGIGHLSDKTKSKFGRRRPYLLLATIPAAVAFYLLMTPPSGTPLAKFGYLTLVSTGMIVALTVFGVPYFALSCSLTSNYDERTRISVYRRFAEIGSEMLAALSIPVMLKFAAGGESESVNESHYYPIAAMLIGGVAVIGAIITFLGTTETQTESESSYGFLDSLKAASRNRPFVILLSTFTLVAVADQVATSLMYYLLEHFHQIPKKDADSLLLAFFAGSLTSAPVWLMLGKSAGKKLAYIVAILCCGCAFTMNVLVRWSHPMLHVVSALMGAAGSGALILPGAIAPDVVEWDQVRTGERREGMYAGISNFTWQLGTGVCFLLVGHFLYFVGYDGDSTPTPQVLLGLRIIFAGLPGVLLIAGAILFCWFPITPKSYREIVTELGARPGASVLTENSSG